MTYNHQPYQQQKNELMLMTFVICLVGVILMIILWLNLSFPGGSAIAETTATSTLIIESANEASSTKNSKMNKYVSQEYGAIHTPFKP